MPALPSTADLQQQLLKFIATIPKDQNPYIALADYIQDAIVPDIPYSGLVQLYLLAAIFGLTLIFVVASILVRYLKGIFWLFQISHSPILIRPHFSLSWSSISVFMLALFEAYIFEVANLFKRDIRPSLGYWVCLIWTICFVGGEWAAWALGVSYLVHVQASGGGRDGNSGRGGRDNIDRWAKVSNYAGIFSPIVYLAIILPLGIITGGRFHSEISTYRQIDGMIRNGEASQNWQVGQPLSIIALTPALPLVTKLANDQAAMITGWKWTYGAYSLLTFILVSVLTLIAVLYLTSLRRRIKQSARDLQGVEGSRSASKQIRLTYQTLQLTIAAMVVLGLVFVSIASYAAAGPESLQRSNTAQILVLGPLYSFAVIGLPTSISLLWRAIEAKSSEGGGSRGENSGTHSAGSGKLSRSRQQRTELDAVKQYSIELGGRRPERSAVNVTVDVLVKEEGELQKWESISTGKL